MKITLDLSKLVEEGRITPADAQRLKALAAQETGSLGINILIGFGVISVSAGAGALSPNATTAVLIGAALFALGLALTLTRAKAWELLAQICVVVGALTFAGGVFVLEDGSLRAAIGITAGFAIAAVIARSSLLIALAVFSLAGCIGARTGYLHAAYSLSIQEPTITIVLFGGLALAVYLLSKNLSADYERLATTAARVSVVMVNFGFWIGSLWGDRFLLLSSLARDKQGFFADLAAKLPGIRPNVFAITWAVALLAAGIWGARANRRWVVNVVAVFAAIHFYTQWFEKLGANAGSVLLAGLLMLAFAFGLWTFNRRAGTA